MNWGPQKILVASLIVFATESEIVHAGELFFTDRTNSINRVVRVADDGSALTVLHSQSNAIFRGIDVDVGQSRAYWVNFSGDDVYSLPVGGGSPTHVLETSFPSGIAIDRANSKVYMTMDTNVSSSHIQRAGLDGSSPQIVANATGFGYGIEVDSIHGKVYWATSSALQRSNLDGTGVQTLWTGNGGLNSGVALDLIHGKVYWNTDDRIFRANLDGSSRVIFPLPGRLINELAVDPIGGALYWTSGRTAPGTGIIEKAGLDVSSPRTIVSGLTLPFGIAFVPEPTTALLTVSGAFILLRRKRIVGLNRIE